MVAEQFFTFASTVCKQMRDKWEKKEGEGWFLILKIARLET